MMWISRILVHPLCAKGPAFHHLLNFIAFFQFFLAVQEGSGVTSSFHPAENESIGKIHIPHAEYAFREMISSADTPN